ELVRQVAHETDRVDQGVRAAVRCLRAPHRRVEGRKQHVLHESPGPRQTVEQRRLARVRVARDRHRGHLIAGAVGARRLTRRRETLDLLAQPRHPGVDASTVEFDLRLTGATRPHTDARTDLTTGLAAHRLTPTAKTRQQVLELSQFDLGLALAALRVLTED